MHAAYGRKYVVRKLRPAHALVVPCLPYNELWAVIRPDYTHRHFATGHQAIAYVADDLYAMQLLASLA
jgi:hypothetical protein